MVQKKVEVSIIVLNWNTKRLLRNCLKSLTSNYEIIVVDNGSTDGSPEMVKKLQNARTPKLQIKLIENKVNLGFGKANNQGMKKAKGDYFLLLNSDTIVKNQAVEKMARFLDSHPKVGVVGCKLLNSDGSSQPSSGRFPGLFISAVMLFAERWFGQRLVRASYDQTKEVDWVMGAAMMVKKEATKKAGLMDEKIFMYMDEVEWCYRIKKASFKVLFYPEAKIVHLGSASSKTGRKDPILNIYRGLIYFYKKHRPFWQLIVLRLMLKLKAVVALVVGYLTANRYLKETYGQALKIS